MNRKDFLKTAAFISGTFASSLLFPDNKIKAKSQVFKNKAPKKLWKYHKEVYHQIKMGRNYQCATCPNRCILEPGDRGICRDKIHLNNKLYNIAYGNPSAVHIDPIEKKPLYHFYPSSLSFSIAEGGCPLRCLNCQNWTLSQFSPEELKFYELFPGDVVKHALESKSKSIAYTYSEPVAWYEYMYDTAKLAREKGIKNIWVTSGYIEEKPLLDLIEVIDAANVDLKSYSEKIYQTLNAGKLEPILRTLKILNKNNIWFEITCLLVPTYTDSVKMIKNMCRWIIDNIGPDYPVHFSRFHPAHKLKHLMATPLSILKQAYYIARDQGLKHVYIGNTPDPLGSNTECPYCHKDLIQRRGFQVIMNKIINSKCGYCQKPISGRWN